MPGVTLFQMMSTAYGTTRARTQGGPDWIYATQWKVAAKAAERTMPHFDVREMVKTMLAERFQLQVAIESKPVSAIVLSFNDRAAHPGLRPTQATIDCEPYLTDRREDFREDAAGVPLCGPPMMANVSSTPLYHFRSAPLTRVARELEIILNQVVVMAAPKDGLFDVDFQAPPGYVVGPAPGDVDAFLSAFHQQLGTDAEIRTMPVDILTIRHVEMPRLGADAP